MLFLSTPPPNLCARKAPHMRSARLLLLTSYWFFSLALAAAATAQAPAENALTNADIVRMAHAGIPESVIAREIQLSPTNFNTSPDALIDLKRRGVSNLVLGAIVDTRSATGRPYTQSPPATHGTAQPSSAVPHHLPSFDADVRLNSKAIGKLSVRRNQISVEKAGVPLFTLKWKVKHTP